MTRAYEIEELLTHAGWLRSLAASLVADPASADDLVQETWIAALRRPPATSVPPRPWLARIFRNRARNARRDESTREAHESRSHAERTPRAPDEIAQEVELQRVLAEAVGELGEPSRTIVVLRYFRGLDSAAIARELALPAGTVRWKLKQALEELRLALDRRFGGDRAAWSALLVPIALGRMTPVVAGKSILLLSSPGAIVTASVAVLAIVTSVGAWLTPSTETPRPGGPLASGPREVDGVSSEFLATELADARADMSPRAQLPAQPAAETTATESPAGDLHGHVLVDGHTPAEPIELALQLGSTPRVFATTDVEGRFAFRDLGAGWKGTLWADGYSDDSDQLPADKYYGMSSMAVDSATTGDVVFRLKGFPVLTARFLGPTSLEPVVIDGARVPHGESQFLSEAGAVCGTTFRTDDDGRMRLPLMTCMLRDDPLRCDLYVEVPNLGRKVVRVPAFRPSERLDLGDVVLDAGVSVPFRIIAPDRTPISGAFAKEPDWETFAKVDWRGAGQLRCVPPQGARFRFTALRYVDRVLDVRSGETPEVVLEPTNAIEVRVRARVDTPLPNLRIHLPDPKRAFVDTPDLWGNVVSTLWLPSGLWSTEEGTFVANCEGRESYEFLLRDLVPGVVFTIELQTQDGRSLASRTVSVGEREWQDLEITLTP